MRLQSKRQRLRARLFKDYVNDLVNLLRFDIIICHFVINYFIIKIMNGGW